MSASLHRIATPPPEEAAEPFRFALSLATALHGYGAPAHRLEEAMVPLCERLGLASSFFATPTGIFATLSQGERREVHLLRVGTGETDLARLSDAAALADRVADGSLTQREGLEGLERLARTPPRYGRWTVALCFAINSGAAARFFGGGPREMAAALAVGLCTGLLSLLSAPPRKPFRAFEPLAAFFGSALATLLAARFGPLSAQVAMLAGIIALVPGYSFTVATFELASRHLASGSARITGAITNFLALAFGVALGSRVSLLFGSGPLPAVAPAHLPGWSIEAALVLAAATFAVLFRAHARDLPWIVLVALLGFEGTRFGEKLLGPELGVFLGALVVGLCSNLWARRLARPAVVTLFPAIMLLVPGSIGFRSLSALMAQDVISGVQTAFSMALVATALVTGLFVANDLLPGRGAL